MKNISTEFSELLAKHDKHQADCEGMVKFLNDRCNLLLAAMADAVIDGECYCPTDGVAAKGVCSHCTMENYLASLDVTGRFLRDAKAKLKSALPVA